MTDAKTTFSILDSLHRATGRPLSECATLLTFVDREEQLDTGRAYALICSALRYAADVSIPESPSCAVLGTQSRCYIWACAVIREGQLDLDALIPPPESAETSVDTLATRLTAHFTKAAAGAVADLHSCGLPAHGDVNGTWREILPGGKKPQ